MSVFSITTNIYRLLDGSLFFVSSVLKPDRTKVLSGFKGLFMGFKTAGWTAVSLSQNKLKSMLLSDLDARTVWCINCLIAFWWIYGNHKWCGNIACTYQILTAEMNTHTFRNNSGIGPALPRFFPNCRKTLNSKNTSNLIGWNIRKAANSLVNRVQILGYCFGLQL